MPPSDHSAHCCWAFYTGWVQVLERCKQETQSRGASRSLSSICLKCRESPGQVLLQCLEKVNSFSFKFHNTFSYAREGGEGMPRAKGTCSGSQTQAPSVPMSSLEWSGTGRATCSLPASPATSTLQLVYSTLLPQSPPSQSSPHGSILRDPQRGHRRSLLLCHTL